VKAVRCPVCAGTGEYYTGTIDGEGKLIGYRACHGCKDKDGISRGWVEVHEEEHSIIPSEEWPWYPGLVPPEDWLGSSAVYTIIGDITEGMGEPATG